MKLVAVLLTLLAILPTFTIHAKGNPQASQSQNPKMISSERDDSLAVLRSLHGKRERRLFRLQQWAKRLKGDMKTIYETYGFPSSRYREEMMGRVTEKWTYLSDGFEFTFRESKLIKTRRFNPSSL